MFEPLKERAKGRWQGILPALGIPATALRNRHGPCPMCGGRDRWRFDDKGGFGTWICSQCGAGDGIELVKLFLGVEFKEAAERIEPHLGAAIVLERKDEVSDARKAEWSRKLWHRSQPIARDDPAGLYLADRCGLTEFPDCLRFAQDERYAEDRGVRPSYHPVMVALMIAHDDSKANLHRTYLAPDGRKADVAKPRAMMPGSIRQGSAVRLMPFTDILGIAEGIETAFAASQLHDGIPVWAALTAGMLEAWIPPAAVRHVMIFGDNDDSNTGQAAAYSLAHRLKAKGMPLDVCIPQFTGDDWNDVWVKRGKPMVQPARRQEVFA